MPYTAEEIKRLGEMEPAPCAGCKHYRADCGYWKPGRKDKGGNPVTLHDPRQPVKCLDYEPKGGRSS